MESENPMPPKIQRFKSKNVKLFLLAFLVALVPLTILVALTQQNLQQSAYMKDTVSFDRILQREQMLVADQMQLADQLDQQIQENDSGDTGTITKMNPLEKQNPAIWDIATNNIDIQREKSLMDQANNINILPGDTITDKLQKIAEKLNL